jgi:hypothetical protein
VSGPVPGSPRPGLVPSIVHGAILAGVVLATVVFVVVRGPFGVRPEAPAAAQRFAVTAVLTIAAVAAVVTPLLLQLVERREPGTDEGGWWQRVLPRAVVVWAVGDLAGLSGAALYFITGRAIALLATLVGIAILTLTAPGRLRDR